MYWIFLHQLLTQKFTNKCSASCWKMPYIYPILLNLNLKLFNAKKGSSLLSLTPTNSFWNRISGSFKQVLRNQIYFCWNFHVIGMVLICPATSYIYKGHIYWGLFIRKFKMTAIVKHILVGNLLLRKLTMIYNPDNNIMNNRGNSCWYSV